MLPIGFSVMTGRRLLPILLVLVLAACAPTATSEVPGSAPANPAAPPGRSEPGKTLVMAIRVEPASVAAKALESGGVTLTTTRRLFNATLTLFDDQGLPTPYLAQSLPQLDSPTWRVSPDGRMETTYALKAGLTWHDGAPFTAGDFAFAWQVYATPELGVAGSPPINQIEEVVAPDSHTVLIRWRRTYPEAGRLTDGLPPLPRHILEPSFQAGPQAGAFEGFTNHPYWTREFVGLGPYRLDRWEPGSAIEAAAFDGHVLGRPRIERVRIVFIGDPNTALANILAGDVHFSADDSIRFQQGLTLKREWGPRNAGSLVVKPDLWRGTYVQLRPEQVNPRALADVRVRRALAHAIDKQLLNEGLFEGEGLMAEVPLIPPTVSYFATVNQVAVKHPYDPRRGEQLLGEAGLVRGADGIYANPLDGRLEFELKTNGSTQNEAEMSILANDFRRAGFDVHEAVLPAAQAQDGLVRNSFPGLYTFSTPLGEDGLAAHNINGIPRLENRWIGSNRGGWVSQEFDRLSQAFTTTLAPSERHERVAEMIRIFTDELPAISLHFNPIPMAHVAALRGPRVVAPEAAVAWNVHQWEFGP